MAIASRRAELLDAGDVVAQPRNAAARVRSSSLWRCRGCFRAAGRGRHAAPMGVAVTSLAGT